MNPIEMYLGILDGYFSAVLQNDKTKKVRR